MKSTIEFNDLKKIGDTIQIICTWCRSYPVGPNRKDKDLLRTIHDTSSELLYLIGKHMENNIIINDPVVLENTPYILDRWKCNCEEKSLEFMSEGPHPERLFIAKHKGWICPVHGYKRL